MSTKGWFEKALQDGREAYLSGKGRDDVPKRRRSSEGRFFWQSGWDQARASVEGSPVKKALDQEIDLQKMIDKVCFEKEEALKKEPPIPCAGEWSHTTNGSDFDCGYDHGNFACEDCIVNGGDRDPRTGRRWRGVRYEHEH